MKMEKYDEHIFIKKNTHERASGSYSIIIMLSFMLCICDLILLKYYCVVFGRKKDFLLYVEFYSADE